MAKYISIKRYKDAKLAYLSDISALDDTDIGNIHRLDEYSYTGKLRKSLIFVPLKYFIFKRFYKYTYYRTFKLCIDELSKSEDIRQLFSSYNIFARKKFNHYAFVSHYKIPEEFQQAEMPVSVQNELIIQHFQSSATKICDDIFLSPIVDYVNVDSLSDTRLLELHFEPIGMYESIALAEDVSLKTSVILMTAAYLIVFLSIVSTFLYFIIK